VSKFLLLPCSISRIGDNYILNVPFYCNWLEYNPSKLIFMK